MPILQKIYSNGYLRGIEAVSAALDEDGEIAYVTTATEGIVLISAVQDPGLFQQLYDTGLLAHES